MEFWEWFTLITGIIGVVAFLMAVSPFVGIIWGAPKIRMDFNEDDRDDLRYLRCVLLNEPIQKGLLAFLRIRRETAPEVLAEFEISERETGRSVLKSVLVEMSTWAGQSGQRISLPASLLGVSFPIVAIKKKDKEVKGLSKMEEPTLLLGRYIVIVRLTVGAKKYKAQRGLTVSRDFPFAYWDVSS